MPGRVRVHVCDARWAGEHVSAGTAHGERIHKQRALTHDSHTQHGNETGAYISGCIWTCFAESSTI